jgi:hypothetical protein
MPMFGRMGGIALFAALALVTTLAASAQARPGFYVGIGGAQQSVKGDLDGTHTYADPSGTPAFAEGKLDSGNVGLTAQIGYGFNRFFGLEYMLAETQHQAKNEVINESSDATFKSQVLGARLTAPFGQRVEGFLRAGYGIYDVTYKKFAATGATLSSRGDVVFSGTGTALGVGLEFFFQELGIGIGMTQHNYKVDRAKPDGGKELGLKSDLSGAATTADVMFSYHF